MKPTSAPALRSTVRGKERRSRQLRRGEARFLASALPHQRHTWHVEVAGHGASGRTFLRVVSRENGTSSVLVVCPERDPNWADFLDIGRTIALQTDLLPAVLSADPRRRLMLMEDAGRHTLHEHFRVGMHDLDAQASFVTSVVDAIVTWQRVDARHSSVVASRRIDDQALLAESAAFGGNFVSRYCAMPHLLDAGWEQDRLRLATEVSGLPRVLVHRDLHSENIIIDGDLVRFVDYGSTSLGPAHYDLAALLFDPLLDLSSSTITSSLGHFHRATGRPDVDRRTFLMCAALRLMNVLGPHAVFVLDRHEIRYRSLLPRSLRNLYAVLEELDDYPGLLAVIRGCLESDVMASTHEPHSPDGTALISHAS